MKKGQIIVEYALISVFAILFTLFVVASLRIDALSSLAAFGVRRGTAVEVPAMTP